MCRSFFEKGHSTCKPHNHVPFVNSFLLNKLTAHIIYTCVTHREFENLNTLLRFLAPTFFFVIRSCAQSVQSRYILDSIYMLQIPIYNILCVPPKFRYIGKQQRIKFRLKNITGISFEITTCVYKNQIFFYLLLHESIAEYVYNMHGRNKNRRKKHHRQQQNKTKSQKKSYMARKVCGLLLLYQRFDLEQSILCERKVYVYGDISKEKKKKHLSLE